MQLLMVPLSRADKKSCPKQLKPQSKMNIERATAICLKKSFFPKFEEKNRKYFFGKIPLADPIFTLDGGFNCFGQLLI